MICASGFIGASRAIEKLSFTILLNANLCCFSRLLSFSTRTNTAIERREQTVSFTFFSLHAIRCLPANKLSTGGGVGLEIRSATFETKLIYFQINFCSDIDKQVGG